MSIGTLISGLFGGGMGNGPLTGLRGGPGALPGNAGTGQPGQGGPQPAPSPGVSQIPSPATQSPPDMVQLYAQLTRQAQAAHGIDQGLGLIAAANSTPSMQRAIMGSIPQQPDPGAMMSNIMQLHQMQLQQQQYAQAAAGAEASFHALFPDAPAGLGNELFATGKLGDVITQHLSSMNPTEAQKNADAAAKAYGQANPGASPQEIAQLKSNLLSGTVGGQTPVERDMRQDMMNWRMQPENAGKTNAQMLTEHPEFANTTVYTAKKAEQTKIATDAGEAKIDAANSFNSVDAGWKAVQQNVNWLNDPTHQQAVIKAIQAPPFMTTGQSGKYLSATPLGYDQDTLDAKSRLDQLQAQLLSENFRNTKNVRSNREAQFLGESATNLFKPTNSPDAITQALGTLQSQVTAGRANATAAAGRQIPAEWANSVDPQLLDPRNPLYNGATLEKAGPPPEAIAHLKANPALAPAFDQKYGPGASMKVLGQ